MPTQFYKPTKQKNTDSKINIWDLISILAIFSIFVILAKVATGMDSPYRIGEKLIISLDTSLLPYYSLRSVLRMAIALLISLLFSLIIGYASAKSKKAEQVFIPLIDILQSVPILGFLSITIIGFIAIFPNSLLGPECAAIFAIFTSQAWNMTLSIYQSIKILPEDYKDVGSALNLNAWQKFWRIELPYATPGLLWNMMISLSGGWFFVVASEAISVNNTEILLPGIGSYIQVAINQSNLYSISFALLAMLMIIFIYDQIIFRPLLKIANQFQDFENDENDIDSKNSNEYSSWVYDLLQRTVLVKKSLYIKDYIADFWINKLALYYKKIKLFLSLGSKPNFHFKFNKYIKNEQIDKIDWFSLFLLIFTCFTIAWLFDFINDHIYLDEILWVITLGLITGIKIFVLVIICSLFWLPVGVYIGSKPNLSKYLEPIIQFLAAFPANLIYPLLVVVIVKYSLNIELATAPLLIIGTQWYILFNIIAGMNTIPKDIKDAVKNYQVKGILWWRKYMLPAVFPYYITGAMTAAGGAWNASIVAESLSWGSTKLTATGLGAYIVNATHSGDFARVALGITIMSLYVTLLNKLLWQKLYDLAANRYQMLN